MKAAQNLRRNSIDQTKSATHTDSDEHTSPNAISLIEKAALRIVTIKVREVLDNANFPTEIERSIQTELSRVNRDDTTMEFVHSVYDRIRELIGEEDFQGEEIRAREELLALLPTRS